MCELVHEIFNEDIFIPMLIAGSVVASIGIKTLGSTIRSVSREKTRREIAAYIAEGSMTPEQGERLMRSGGDSQRPCA